MRKIVFALNSQQPDTHSIDFACYIAKTTHSKLTVFFIEGPDGQMISSAYQERKNSPKTFLDKEIAEGTLQKVETNKTVAFFKEACTNRGVEVSICEDIGDVVDKIAYESRFADLLIMDPEICFDHKAKTAPTRFVKEVLVHAECPVLIAPDLFEGIEEIIFCYDGSACSVFAIKQFTYLFPEYKNTKATILHISTPKESNLEKENQKIQDWLNPHYASVHFQSLEGEVKDELFTYFLNKQKQFVVMGAYGRGLLSNFFRKSSADLVMHVIDLPLFIAHH